MPTRKPSKYVIEFVIQSTYPWQKGWEDVTTEETLQDARAQLKCYRANEPQYSHRLIRRRVLREPAAA